MKYFLFSFLLIFVGCGTFNNGTSGPATTPMEKANVILIETSDTVEESYEQVNGILEKEGFSVKEKNKSEQQLHTNSKTYDDIKVWLSSSISDSDSSAVIKLSGMVEVPEFQHRVEYGGAKPEVRNRIQKKEGAYNPAWKIMMRVALQYPEGKIWYVREA